ncbi:carbohydrate ABC transporter substrate-binding protein (CUT1 family) [Rhodovulum imhoffii]|uniref:Carbohydrate ABC transporter substrate-binding protein (CUT1 family) n=1 Tax=Rhodovulum imhoffii TaxID=365340 RepID=A0A2T5BPP2_9RHOB|nr:extracellular solute-binding protein [Rhodovulum imhoffii]MBK5933571.1 ABC transporter substrate-binding protein [Rhodovulum imhoffii]PTN01010.1 carbohydrate ABC transporter substrate-binding protein (CUT1 family) [Rhodovulum imhoffii]
MTREELLRILTFVDSNRELSEKRTSLATVDPRWNIVSYAMRRHLEGKLLTVTSAAMAADVPYGTAMRRISELIEEGFLHKRPKSRTGKSFSLHPTRKLISEIESFATQLKSTVGNTFGFTTGDGEISDFYFGGYYMASRTLPYPSAMRAGVGVEQTFRILSPIDPTFKTLSEFSSNLDELCGTNIEIVNLPLDELLGEIMNNAQREISKYDLMAVDLPWIGQLATENVIEPLNEIMSEERYNPSDFHNAAYRGSSWNNCQYGLPIQPTAELLFCRSDLFAEAGLTSPRTTDELLLAARVLHRSTLNLSGIVMNFGRGTPVAHTFVQTLADFGQPVINLDPLGVEFNVNEIRGENYRPLLNTDVARETAEFLLELLAFSHRDSLSCNWDRRISIFSKGEAAMTYGWSIRAAAFELNDSSPAHGNVQFVPHPHGPGARTVSPIGGFSLAMPSGLSTQRKAASWKVMEYLTRPEMLKWYVLNGNPTSPRFSTSADPEVQASSAMISAVDAMERRGELQTWPRPPIPEFSDLLSVLGVEIHMMLQGVLTVEQALSNAQNRIDALMRERGRY